MKRLIEYTKILRSKNAGPLYITFDLIFNTKSEMKYISDRLTAKAVAQAYGVGEECVDIIEYDIVNSIKITFPRKYVSGSIYDNDIYGCQQHMPLGNILI